MPGTLMFSIFGLLGQSIYNKLDAQQLELQGSSSDTKDHGKALWRRMADSKWSPMKVLTDAEYEAMIREKLLGVNAEIALIDEKINSLKESKEKDTDTGKRS